VGNLHEKVDLNKVYVLVFSTKLDSPYRANPTNALRTQFDKQANVPRLTICFFSQHAIIAFIGESLRMGRRRKCMSNEIFGMIWRQRRAENEISFIGGS
jgi:hypothetical protein